MPDFEKILIFKNEIEAGLMESILKERNIPYLIKSYHDLAYDGLFQLQKGWGHLEASPNDRDEIISIYSELCNE